MFSKHIWGIFSLIFGLLFLISYQSTSFSKEKKESKYESLKVFSKALSLIKENYVEDIPISRIIHGGIKGMLRELDPHSHFLTPEVYESFNQETQGEFGGIGVEMSIQKGIPTIISPIEDTPAWRAGLKSGDQIISINGKPTEDATLPELAKNMKGEIGQFIRMGIMRKGLSHPKIYKIKREIIKIRSVKSLPLSKGYFYVRITSFLKNTSRNLRREIARYQSQAKIKGLVIDVRKNPGGLLGEAVKTSDLFIDKGIIVQTMNKKTKKKEVATATKRNTFKDFPVVVLIDEYSASASEILAGALQDNKRALVVGRRSFGKGSVQSVMRLEDGSAIKLTVARYYTPKGRSIQAEGIQPDIVLENINLKDFKKSSERIFREENITNHLSKEGVKKSQRQPSSIWSKKDSELSKREKLVQNDFQIIQAYKYLKAWKTMDLLSKPE